MSRRREMQERFPPTSRFKTRNSMDTIRSPNSDDGIESTRANLLRGNDHHESYEGTRFNVDDIDTEFPPENIQDVESRFGVSTRNIINERYDSSTELDPGFSEGYQLDNNYRNRVGYPPRGIFDDV